MGFLCMYVFSHGGSLQEKVEQLESALKEQQQQLLSVQLQANEANNFAKVTHT